MRAIFKAIGATILIFFLINVGLAVLGYEALGVEVIQGSIEPPIATTTSYTEIIRTVTDTSYSPITTTYTTAYTTVYTTINQITQTQTTSTQTISQTSTITSTVTSTITLTQTLTQTQTTTQTTTTSLTFVTLPKLYFNAKVTPKISNYYLSSNWINFALEFFSASATSKRFGTTLYIKIGLKNWLNGSERYITKDFIKVYDIPWIRTGGGPGYEYSRHDLDWNWTCPFTETHPAEGLIIILKCATPGKGEGSAKFISPYLNAIALANSEWHFHFCIELHAYKGEGNNWGEEVSLIPLSYIEGIKASVIETPTLSMLTLGLGNNLSLKINTYWFIPLSGALLLLIFPKEKRKRRK